MVCWWDWWGFLDGVLSFVCGLEFRVFSVTGVVVFAFPLPLLAVSSTVSTSSSSSSSSSMSGPNPHGCLRKIWFSHIPFPIPRISHPPAKSTTKQEATSSLPAAKTQMPPDGPSEMWVRVLRSSACSMMSSGGVSMYRRRAVSATLRRLMRSVDPGGKRMK